ncbi:hypothetical protein E2P81_ATG01035 [Venturia nashicola]|nr:hypothetical protein E2P81_ATG01035 [Venturia nashicola]
MISRVFADLEQDFWVGGGTVKHVGEFPCQVKTISHAHVHALAELRSVGGTCYMKQRMMISTHVCVSMESMIERLTVANKENSSDTVGICLDEFRSHSLSDCIGSGPVHLCPFLIAMRNGRISRLGAGECRQP